MGMTTEHEASRTLVKSPPELWAECSDAASLARHLGEFGEIKITRLEPETAIAWEGEQISGTVRIEPSAWGTRVTLTAQTTGEAVTESPVAEEAAAEEAAAEDAHAAEEPDEAALAVAEEPVAFEAAPAPEEPVGVEQAPPIPKLGLMARMRRFFRPAAEPEMMLAVEPSQPEAAQELDEVEAPQQSVLEAEPEPDPTPVEVVPLEPMRSEPEPEGSVPPAAPVDHEAALVAALDSLGQAHHRPFSRA